MTTADPMSTVFSARPAPAPAPPPPTVGGAHVVEEVPTSTAPIPVPVEAPTAPIAAVEAVAVPKAKTKVKSRRLNIDAIGVLIFTVVIVFALMGASFAASAVAIYEVSVHTGIGPEWRWVFPVFIDLAIFAYTISLFIFKRRGESTVRTIIGLLLFSLLSIGANIAHTVDYWNGDLGSFQAWVGVALAAAAPVGVLLASEEIARLAFSAPDEE